MRCFDFKNQFLRRTVLSLLSGQRCAKSGVTERVQLTPQGLE